MDAVRRGPNLVLAAAGEDHGKGEDQAAERVGIVELGALPAELLLDGALEHAPGVEDAEGEVDAECRQKVTIQPRFADRRLAAVSV